MTLQEWFAMQADLDYFIQAEHQLQNEDLFEKKILSLLVELGELANETRCFKFWSRKPPSDEKVILEEFVDGVHFILSIGLELGYEDQDISIVSSEGNEELVQTFLKIYQLINELRKTRSVRDYTHLIRQYFIFG